jgi:hypothetical protein
MQKINLVFLLFTLTFSPLALYAQEVCCRDSMFSDYTGHCLNLHPNGNVKIDGNLKNGQWHGEHKEFYTTGKLKVISNLENGEISDGKTTFFHLDGTIERELIMKNEFLTIKIYHLNGKIKHLQYANSYKSSGVWKEYDTTGNVIKTTDYTSPADQHVLYLPRIMNGGDSEKKIERDRKVYYPAPPAAPVEEEKVIVDNIKPDVEATFKFKIQAFYDLVNYGLPFPEDLTEEKFSANVIVSFRVEADKKINDIKIIQGISPKIDKIIKLRVSTSLSSWKPGTINGENVSSVKTVSIPITIESPND